MCKAVKPTGQSDYQEMERLYGVYHCTITLSLIFSDNNIIRLVRIFAPYGVKRLERYANYRFHTVKSAVRAFNNRVDERISPGPDS